MPDPDATARRLLDLLGTGRSIAPPLAGNLDLAAAYRIAARLRGLREARGERPVGRKIGFTNTTIWPRYGVSAPMWGYVFDTTVTDLPAADGSLEVAGLAEPRIEPEIVFGIAASPAAGMDDAALLGCIGWVAHGFELVQSVYPGWRFTLPEATAAFALHGALAIGPRHPLGEDRAAWAEALGRFTVSLRRDGAEVEQGSGAFVLGSPLRALGFLVETIAADPEAEPLHAGEIVTTGTLTDAQPIRPGERWTTALDGIDLPGLDLRIL